MSSCDAFTSAGVHTTTCSYAFVPLQENRVITPILFSLLLLIVFFVWVNVMVAIISEVYANECERSLNIAFDADFRTMAPDVLQPGNDLDAMVPHAPARSHPDQPQPHAVALTPDRRAARSARASQMACLRVGLSCMRGG